MEKKIKINVLIVTYCQENVITRAIESVLMQGMAYLNKIIISDDCSIDDTWRVISEYAIKYPDIIEPYRNERNLGIYGNMNTLLSLRGKADMYYFLSGDDVIGEGWFEKVSDYVVENNISLSDAVGIFGDYKTISPLGLERMFNCNSLVTSHRSLFGLHLRGMISNRSLLVTEGVLTNCKPVDTTKGVGYAESLFNNQQLEAIERAYYLPICGNVYYAGIGVSKKILDYDPDYYTDIELLNFFLKSSAREFSDIHFIKSKIDAALFIKNHNVCKLFTSVLHYILGMKGYPFLMKIFIGYYRWLIMFVIRDVKR